MAPRCRTIGGVSYALTPAPGKGCARGRPPAARGGVEKETPISTPPKKATPARASSAPKAAPARASSPPAGNAPALEKRIAVVREILERAPEPLTLRHIRDEGKLIGDPSWEVDELVKRGLVRRAKHRPGWQVDRRYEYVSGSQRDKVKPRALPPPVDVRHLKRGDKVTIFYRFATEGEHATIDNLPGDDVGYGRLATQPSVHFTTGEQQGFRRYVNPEQIFAGWIERKGWKPWKG